MSRRRFGFPALLLFAAACASPGAAGSKTHPLEQELSQFQACQQVFREQNTAPYTFDFPGHGRVTVREVTLDGFPGNTYVRCRFHYQNRTAKPVARAWVYLDVLDGQGRMVGSQASILFMPIPTEIARGSYFADELRAQTYDAHLQPGWSWRIRCKAIFEEEDEPLDPPAPEPGRITIDPAPVILKPAPWRVN
ncbi:MAG: hypothetical protein JNK49_10650 [Planctomycetes bacterium]|nr:hypothetical protein [Planctomycetota bacterium]